MIPAYLDENGEPYNPTVAGLAACEFPDCCKRAYVIPQSFYFGCFEHRDWAFSQPKKLLFALDNDGF